MANAKSNPNQILSAILDATNQSIKTTMVGTQVAITVTAADGDSVRVWQGDTPIDFDSFSQTLSAANTVVTTTYFSGGLAGTSKGTVVRTFSDNTRTFLISMVRT